MKIWIQRLNLLFALLMATQMWGAANIVITEVAATTGDLKPGDTVTVDVTVANTGDADLLVGSPITVNLTSAFANTGGGGLDKSSAAGLAIGETLNFSFSFDVDAADANGAKPITLAITAGGNDTDSSASVTVEAHPDLQVESLEIADGTYYPGSMIPLTLSYTNAGDRATGGTFELTVNIDEVATGKAPDTVTVTGIAALDAGESATMSAEIRLPLDNPNETYTVRVNLDTGSDVDEVGNEDNNEGTATFTVNTKPDLEITDLDYETGTWVAGDIIDFSLSYQNAPAYGGANTLRVTGDEPYKIEVVLSTDDVFGNEDDFLLYGTTISGNPNTGGNLLPNNATAGAVDELITFDWAQAIPRNFFGDYFVLAKIEVDEDIEEYVEDNASDNGNNIWYALETAKISIVPSANPEPTTFRASVKTDGTEGEGMSEKPSVSADGQYVAFSTLSALVEEDTDTLFDIYVRDNLTGEVRLMSPSLDVGRSDGDSINPVISNDGRYVVFVSESANLIGGDTNGHRDIFRANLTTGAIELVSRADGATGALANSSSALPDLSSDGSLVVFQSTATNLTGDGLNASLNLYIRDMAAGTTRLLVGGNGDSFEPKISGEGDYVVFTSEATDIVVGTLKQNVFRVDTTGLNPVLISKSDTTATGGDADSFEPEISDDGSVVVFATWARDIDAPGGDPLNDGDGLSEIIVAKIDANTSAVTTKRLMAGSDQFNNPGNESPEITGARQPSISGDGQRIVFRTQSNNLLPKVVIRSDADIWDEADGLNAVGYMDLNSVNVGAAAVSDVYLYDEVTDKYSLISVNKFGYQGARVIVDNLPNVPSVRDAVISSNGRYVAFSSDGRDAYGHANDRTNRISSDDNEVRDVFVHDLRTTAAGPLENPPSFTSFALDQGSLTVGQTDILRYAVEANVGFIESVKLYLNGGLVENYETADGFYQWTPAEVGTYHFYAVATNSDGYSAVSSIISVSVSHGNAPTVVFTAPDPEDILPVGGADGIADTTIGYGIEQRIVVSAEANTGSSSPVVGVEIFVDGVSLGTDTAAPYELSWTPSGPGNYRLVAIATDLAGRKGISDLLVVKAVAPLGPVVVLESPSPIDINPVDGKADQTLLAGDEVTLSATASARHAAVNTVEFLVDGVSAGAGVYNSLNERYEVSYTPMSAKTITLKAVATDLMGNQGTATLDYEVIESNGPTVTLISPDPADAEPNGVADESVSEGISYRFEAEVNGVDGNVTSVEFKINGTSIGQGVFDAGSGYYYLDYTPTVARNFVLSVVAKDDIGNQTTGSMTYYSIPENPVSDLRITEVAVSEGTYYPGSPIMITGSYVNAGPDSITTDFKVKYLILPDSLEGRPLEETVTVAASGDRIEVGETVYINKLLYIPTGNDGGDFTVTVSLDSDSAIVETDETNNIGTSEVITVDEPEKPDLVISDMNYESGEWSSGDIIDFSLDYHLNTNFEGKYTGHLNAYDSYEVWVVLSTDLVYGNEDDFLLYAVREVGNGAGDALLPYYANSADIRHDSNQLVQIEWSQMIPRNLYGDFFVIAKIDEKNEIEETIDDDAHFNGNNTYYSFETAKISIVPSAEPQSETYRASVRSDGTEGNGLSEEPDLSEDGRYLVFSSLSQLSSEDTDTYYDIYLRNNSAGTVELISKATVGSGSDGDSRFPSISEDGRRVAFSSASEQLVAGDNNGLSDIFIVDVSTGAIRNVTAGGNGDSTQPDLSADGSKLVFQSNATNLTADNLALGLSRVFAYDYTTKTISLVTTAFDGSGVNKSSYEPAVSGDGLTVVFTSDATNLVATATAGRQIYRAGLDGSGMLLVSQDSTGDYGDSSSINPSVNEDGTVVAYATFATNIDAPVGGDSDALAEIIVADISGNAVVSTRLLTSDGEVFNDPGVESAPMVGALSPSLSSDGNRIVFRTQSNNILPSTVTRFDGAVWDEQTRVAIGYTDTNSYSTLQNPVSDIYLYDRETQKYQIASVNRFGYQGSVFLLALNEGDALPSIPSSRDGVISANGRYVAFSSDGRAQFGFDHDARSNQISNDTNEVRDVFIHDLKTGDGLTVTNPPIVTINATATGRVGLTNVIEVTASDTAPGTIKEVRLLINNTTVSTQIESNYFYQWTPTIPGIYELTAIATDNEGFNTHTSITVTVSDTGAPTIGITSPTTIVAGTSVSFTAVANPNTVSKSPISEVEFFVNGESIGTDTGAPYAINWLAEGPGEYFLTAVAKDKTGKKGITSKTLQVVAGSAPNVAIVSPPNGGHYQPGTLLPVLVLADDPDGEVERVEFYINGNSQGTVQTAPYQMILTVPSEGTYDLTARAIDTDGNATYSAKVTINSGGLDGMTPRVVVTQPLSTDAEVSAGSETFINVEVTDPDGSAISAVRFYANGTLIETVTTGVGHYYGTSLELNTIGDLALYAAAEDADGNIGQTVPLVLKIGVPAVTMPSVSMRPVGLLSQAGDPIALYAEVGGIAENIRQVDYFANGVFIGTVEEPTADSGTMYVLEWTPEEAGIFELAAKVIEAGESGTEKWALSSETVSLVVKEASVSTPPSISLRYPEDGQVFAVDSRVLLQAGGVDPDGVIEQVEFFIEAVDGMIAVDGGVDQTAPFSYEWSPLVPGEYRITAIATDDSGDYSPSSTRTVTVISATGTGPTVALISPDPADLDADGVADNTIRVNTLTNLEVEVSNVDQLIDTVRFYINGNLLGDGEESIQAGVYELAWRPRLVGDYFVTAVVRDIAGNERNARLLYRVVSASSPTVKIDSPLDGAVVTASTNKTLVVQASAIANAGSISVVQFYQNGGLIGTDATYPYSVSFVPGSEGSFEFVARAVNTFGAVGLSSPISITVVGRGPTEITIQNPVNNAEYSVGKTIPVIANVTVSGSGASLRVEFFANGNSIGIDDTAPYLVNWVPGSAGTYAISAVVTETSNSAQASSLESVITVTPSASPVVHSLGAQVASPTAGSDLQITADVTDEDGYVISVDFYAKGVSLGLDETAPFSAFWKPGSAGSYELQALATDNSGNVTIYTQNITVKQPVGLAPSVSMGITANGNVTPGSRVVVTANVYDDKPGVEVVFFVNGSQIGEPDTEAPYSIILDPQIGVGSNAYSVMALASDSDGNSRAVVQTPLYISDVSREQPNVWILTPSAGDNLTEGSRASLRAQMTGGAADNVASVIFYANGVQIGRDTTAPYAIDWLPDQLGEVSITVAVLQNVEQYDHDVNVDTATISVTPVATANPVLVNVNERVGELPSVSFDVLPETTNIAQGSEVMFYADVQDRDGTVTSVEFFVEGVSVGAPDTEAPFGMLWKTEQEGEFFVNAVATDNEGNVVNSNFVPVQIASSVVTKTPQIDLANPTTGQSGDFITLRSSVRDFVNGPERVVFYVDGQEVGEVTEKPYNFVWEANLEGDVSVFATAYQPLSSGAVVTASSAISVIELAADENPVVTAFDYSFPNQSGSKVNPLVAEKISFSIWATDNGVIESVELVRNGQTVQSTNSVSTPLNLSDTPPGVGSYSYSVVVTDNAGRQTVANLGGTIEVVTGNSPTVKITSPDGTKGDNLIYLPNDVVQIRATATDTDGTVVGVQFYVNGLELGAMDTTQPYEASFTTSISGTYLIQVRAQDNSGNLSALSAGVEITMQGDEPPTINEFSFDLPGSGTTGDPYIARLNQVFTIGVNVGDDHNSLASLKLVRNTTTISNPGGVPVPLEYTDVLTTPAVYTYQLEARDTGGNVRTSDLVRVKATLGTKPTVVIESPIDGAEVSVGKSLLVSAMPFVADETQSDPGTISRVDFFVFGQLINSTSIWPYTASFIPSAEGTWEISAIAYSDTGLGSDKSIVHVDAFVGSVPEITKFTNSTSGDRVLTNTPITFTVDVNDTSGIKRVELLLADANIDGDNIVVTSLSAPYTLTYEGFETSEVGTHIFQARAINTTGRSTLSETVEIKVESPDPENSASDFVFQSFNDMLLRAPTTEEENDYIATFAQNKVLSQQDADEIMIVDMMEFDPLAYESSGYAAGTSPIWEEYRMVRAAVMARYVLTGAWPTREELVDDVRLIRLSANGVFGELNLTEKGQAVRELVKTLIPAFQEAFWDGNALPTSFDSTADRERFVRILLDRKYGVTVSNVMVSKAANYARLEGRDTFVAKLMMDTEIASAVGLTYVYALPAPNNNDLRRADAAALMINLLRSSPSEEEVNTLAEKELYSMVKAVLNDSGYLSRFDSGLDDSVVHAGGWRKSDWFGWFQYKDNGTSGTSAQWNYHLDLGWVYFALMGQTESSFWYYDPSLGWTWTSADRFPAMYSSSRGDWLFSGLYGYAYGEDRWFYSYGENQWIGVK